MSPKPRNARLTDPRSGERSMRVRLRVEFSPPARRKHPKPVKTDALIAESAGDTHTAGEERAASSDLELFLKSVSETIASEAASHVFTAGERRPTSPSADFVIRINKALEDDIAVWLGEAKHPRGQRSRSFVRTLKEWSKRSAPLRELLLERVLDTTLDPLTWTTALKDVGPRPDVSVLLFVPGSIAYASRAAPLEDIDLAIVYRGVARAASELDELSAAMTPDIPVPAPATVLQARRNAEARGALLSDFGALTAADVAQLAGSEAKNTSALAGRWRREGRLVAVEHQGRVYYPGFQFDSDGQPRPVVAEVLKQLHAPGMTPWQQALWFTTANGWLDGDRPVDLVDTRPDAVAAAAREALREPVG